ncbi:hypothetical protein FKV24_015560 [Lysobacter maris]|uniref:DUF998 domain-containing protein n=1 Tax=Marilutibacter maris TaxID=1605891 RepID=A0A508A9C2_9GAMM|nr:hypothetical protein [Lysobacter maris]KAB8172107.1 hypothetical protein FKV24_015560 [Lysobacter maris]
MDSRSGPMPACLPPPWWLPLLCALLPLVAGHVALWLSVRDGLVPACVPYIDGCVSISRAARHGVGNGLFKALMLPAAGLQALFWWRARRWLQLRGGRDPAEIAWLGIVAGAFLALYTSALGSEGEIYGLLRRYGITAYFGGTFLALMALLRRMSHDREDAPGFAALRRVAVGMLAVGLTSVAVTATLADPMARERWENRLEWILGLWLTAMFLVFAWQWWRERRHAVPR